MIHVCLTHDIDRIDKTYQYVTKPLKALKKGDFNLFQKRLFSPFYVKNAYWGFDQFMEIELEFDVRSTCFFLNETIHAKWNHPNTWKLGFGRYDIHDKRIVDVIKKLDEGGWEIGLHGSYLSYKNHLLLKQEKDTLEKILGHKVNGIRQHYLNFDNTTWAIQDSLGFSYDSTWGLADGIGFKQGKIIPFFPIQDSLFCEIPMTIMDGPFASTQNRWEVFNDIINEIDKNDAFIVINYHNNNFDPLDYPGYLDDYVKMIRLLKERKATFLTMIQAYNLILSNR